jgi:ADP-ribosyl-[dinitrogen reductase] hydrolase
MISWDSCEGGLLGLLAGDALGVPYEFHAAANIPPTDAIHYSPPAGFRKAHPVPPGTWSDDGAQALCLLASLHHSHTFDVDDFGTRLLRWYEEGYCAVDGHVFDVGVQTSVSLRSILRGTPAAAAGGTDVRSNGNGSLMRALPVFLANPNANDEALVALAYAQSRVTHAHPRSLVCCALYVLWAKKIVSFSSDTEVAWREATGVLRQLLTTEEEREALEFHIRPDEPLGRADVSGSGYVVDCLRSARFCARESNWLCGVRAAISLGNDTDTTACVVGGILGLRDGKSRIPSEIRQGLRGTTIYEEAVVQLRARFDAAAAELAVQPPP